MRALEAVMETPGWLLLGAAAASDSNTAQPVNTHSQNCSHVITELISRSRVCVVWGGVSLVIFNTLFLLCCASASLSSAVLDSGFYMSQVTTIIHHDNMKVHLLFYSLIKCI